MPFAVLAFACLAAFRPPIARCVRYLVLEIILKNAKEKPLISLDLFESRGLSPARAGPCGTVQWAADKRPVDRCRAEPNRACRRRFTPIVTMPPRPGSSLGSVAPREPGSRPINQVIVKRLGELLAGSRRDGTLSPARAASTQVTRRKLRFQRRRIKRNCAAGPLDLDGTRSKTPTQRTPTYCCAGRSPSP
jgi:hypothetical protein